MSAHTQPTYRTVILLVTGIAFVADIGCPAMPRIPQSRTDADSSAREGTFDGSCDEMAADFFVPDETPRQAEVTGADSLHDGDNGPAGDGLGREAILSDSDFADGPDQPLASDDADIPETSTTDHQADSCVPDCAQRPCGEGGCTSDCGTCEAHEVCEAGRCLAKMIGIPAGDFMMGCNEAIDNQCDIDDELPYHKVQLSAFEIAETEVTVAQYRRCVESAAPGACTQPGCLDWDGAGREEHPVQCVDWQQAKTYCAWAGRRLCTEAEWEKAARGADGRLYPWNDDTVDCQRAVTQSCNEGDTAPVASLELGRSPYQVYDMAGNVQEWVSDGYVQNAYAACAYLRSDRPDCCEQPDTCEALCTDPEQTVPDSEESPYVIRGGGARYPPTPADFRCASRNSASQNNADPDHGIRCCRASL